MMCICRTIMPTYQTVEYLGLVSQAIDKLVDFIYKAGELFYGLKGFGVGRGSHGPACGGSRCGICGSGCMTYSFGDNKPAEMAIMGVNGMVRD